MATWNEIRSMWVNGERQEAKEKLYQLPKRQILKVIKEALDKDKAYRNHDTWSGDMADLREILTLMVNPHETILQDE